MKNKYTYLIIVLLILGSLIAFGRITGNDFINFDDNVYITENNHIKSGISIESIKWAFTSSHASNWHPLTWLSHMLDWQLFGANASGHHFVSLLLHISSAIFLFLFLNRTTGALWPAAFVAALFALHPLRVESVAWASERKDVLSMFLGLASIYTYAYYVESSKLSKYFISLMLFALSLLAKPMLATLPFVLLLLDYWPLGRWQKALQSGLLAVNNNDALAKKKVNHRKVDSAKGKKIFVPPINSSKIILSLLWEKVPFISLAIASCILTVWAQYNGIASLDKLPFTDRILNAIVSYVAYIVKIFWPLSLAVLYPYEQFLPSWQVFGAAAILLGISISVIYAIKKAPYLFVGWFWYLGTLVPVIGLMQVGNQSMADRYTYLPSIGIGILIAWGAAHLLPKKEQVRKKIIIPVVSVLLTAIALLTWQQCGYWKNSFSLFNHALLSTQNNYLAYTNLGVALDAEGKKEQAFAHYLSALKINPHYDKAHYNLAMAYKEQGNIKASSKHFQEALLSNPNFADAHNNMGIILEMHYKKYDEAIYNYRQALQNDSSNAGTHFNLGIALAKNGEVQEAIKNFRLAINIKPDYEEARWALKLAQELEKRQ